MIEQEYISFETAKLAKEKGFNEPCKYFYEEVSGEVIKWEISDGLFPIKINEFLCPTQSLLARWLREKFNIQVTVYILKVDGFVYTIQKYYDDFYKLEEKKSEFNYDTYEDALKDGIIEALKYYI